MTTKESMALTHAFFRTECIAHPLVVMPSTLRPTVTQVVDVHTHSRFSTTIKTRARQLTTIYFIFMIEAIINAIASCIDR